MWRFFSTKINCESIKGDIKTLFKDVVTVIKDADCAFVNVECALTESNYTIKKFGPNLKADPKCAKILKEVGFTHCLLSNNHIFDCGIDGVKDAIATLVENGLSWTGFGQDSNDSRRNLVVESGNKKICVIDVCEHEYSYALENRMGTRAFDLIDTLNDIDNAKKENDVVMVIYHGGKEQCLYTSPRLMKVCHAMSDKGADIVACQHSHCIGCYENYNDSHIVYGQGNFHFIGMNDSHPHWKNGLILLFDIDNGINISFVPVVVCEKGIRLANETETKEIMDSFENRSEEIKNGKWIDGWKEFCKDNIEGYTNVVKNAYSDNDELDWEQLFSHYLRCEAHHDVWDEIYRLSWKTRLEP